jgi:hypothetical protein
MHINTCDKQAGEHSRGTMAVTMCLVTYQFHGHCRMQTAVVAAARHLWDIKFKLSMLKFASFMNLPCRCAPVVGLLPWAASLGCLSP